MTFDYRGRDWSEMIANQRMPMITGDTRAKRRYGTDSPL